MYRDVAERPGAGYHFELGRALAERLGYPAGQLDAVPAGAVESFAGVGYFFDLLDLRRGESVVDLGSGSGMDSFIAAQRVGPTGRVVGVDMTPEQLSKAERLRREANVPQLTFVPGRIEHLPIPAAGFDAAMSNGVINLAADKRAVFAEVARVLKPGGRLALADIVSQAQLPSSVVCNADLWASCIGGAAQVDEYRIAIRDAGLVIEDERWNAYEFRGQQALRASRQYGVMSLSLLARKPS
jgi:SAM-dependent methyltransferase